MAGRFGTKGLAISFISTEEDGKVLTDVQSRFEVKVMQKLQPFMLTLFQKILSFMNSLEA